MLSLHAKHGVLMRWFAGYFDDIGFVITGLGFGITIWQLLELKSRQKVVETTTNAAMNRLATFDNAMRISKSKEAINHFKSTPGSSQFPFIDQKIPELKEELDYCMTICPEQEVNILDTIQALNSMQSDINKGLINSNKDTDFDFEAFFIVLDDTRDIFTSAIAKCTR
jgi:hypothetical protein